MAAGRLATLVGTPLAPTPTVYRSSISHRTLRLGLLLMAFVILTAVVSSDAMAKTKSCADQVIGDWFDDGQVDKIYPLECYRQAIKNLPRDLLIYGNAEEEIGRALAFAKQGKSDPGGKGPTPPTTSTGKTGTGKTGTGKTGTGKTGTGTTETSTQTTDTSGPSSLPIPLLVLGGLAVLLLAAGSAGYLRRRLGSDDDGTPPASA